MAGRWRRRCSGVAALLDQARRLTLDQAEPRFGEQRQLAPDASRETDVDVDRGQRRLAVGRLDDDLAVRVDDAAATPEVAAVLGADAVDEHDPGLLHPAQRLQQPLPVHAIVERARTEVARAV